MIELISLTLCTIFGFFATLSLQHIFDPCKIVVILNGNYEDCTALDALVAGDENLKLALFALKLIVRVEACCFFAVGVTSLYGLLFCNNNQRKPIFLLNATIFGSAALMNCHIQGFLPGMESPSYAVENSELMNFLIGDTVLATLAIISFFKIESSEQKAKKN